MQETLEIPNKSMFKLNEVCGLTGVKPYVLRFWESEFVEIDPIISSSGQKMYDPKDIEAIATLKNLLFLDKLNIEQAKAELSKRLNGEHEDDSAYDSQLEAELPEIPESLARPQMNLNISRMALSEGDLDKLMMAKNLLREVIS